MWLAGHSVAQGHPESAFRQWSLVCGLRLPVEASGPFSDPTLCHIQTGCWLLRSFALFQAQRSPAKQPVALRICLLELLAAIPEEAANRKVQQSWKPFASRSSWVSPFSDEMFHHYLKLLLFWSEHTKPRAFHRWWLVQSDGHPLLRACEQPKRASMSEDCGWWIFWSSAPGWFTATWFSKRCAKQPKLVRLSSVLCDEKWYFLKRLKFHHSI